MVLPPLRDRCEPSFQEECPANPTLKFSTRCLGKGERLQQCHCAHRKLMCLHYGTADGSDNCRAIEALECRASQLNRDRELLYTLDRDPERGARARLESRVAYFDGAFNVLRIMITAADDDDVLN